VADRLVHGGRAAEVPAVPWGTAKREGEPVQTIRLNAKYLLDAAKSHSGSEFVDIDIRPEPNGIVFRSEGVDTMVLPIDRYCINHFFLSFRSFSVFFL
jgi:hypothetical protein